MDKAYREKLWAELKKWAQKNQYGEIRCLKFHEGAPVYIEEVKTKIDLKEKVAESES